MKKTIFISSGEVSGDLHGSYLVKELLSLEHEIEIVGFGSYEMEKVGVKILKDVAPYSGVGIIENIPAVFHAGKSYQIAKKYFSENKPDIVILIDNQGFNLKLAQLAKKYDLKVVYYIGPQEWIWGFSNGKKRVLKNIDKLFSVFRKEYEFYSDFKEKVEYVGNPLLQILKKENKSEIKKQLNIFDDIIIGIMPGSRKQEINSLLPIFLETAKKLKIERNIDSIIIVNSLWKNYIKENFKIDNIRLLEGNSNKYMQVCDLIIAASGTVTLEAAILEIPIISNYKLSSVSYNIAKILIKLDYFSLPNIIAGKKIIPEYIQENVSVENLFKNILYILDNKENHQKLIDEYAKLKESLKPENAITRVAKIIYDFIK